MNQLDTLSGQERVSYLLGLMAKIKVKVSLSYLRYINKSK